MTKVLAIIGSPRRGETLKAVQRFEEELKKLGDVEMETVMLLELGLRDCLGCHNCFMKGEQTCPEAAKVQAMRQKMMAADLVLLASPTYNQGVTAIMKKFLDYFTFLWHRPGMFGVKFFGLATGGGMFGGVFKTMKENVASWGGSWAGELGVPHYEALTTKYRAKLDRDFTKKAALVMKTMENRALPRPALGRLLSFRMWRMNAGLGFSPADLAHWKQQGWLDRKCMYYYNASVNPAANVLATALMGLARRFMRSVYVGY